MSNTTKTRKAPPAPDASRLSPAEADALRHRLQDRVSSDGRFILAEPTRGECEAIGADAVAAFDAWQAARAEARRVHREQVIPASAALRDHRSAITRGEALSSTADELEAERARATAAYADAQRAIGRAARELETLRFLDELTPDYRARQAARAIAAHARVVATSAELREALAEQDAATQAAGARADAWQSWGDGGSIAGRLRQAFEDLDRIATRWDTGTGPALDAIAAADGGTP